VKSGNSQKDIRLGKVGVHKIVKVLVILAALSRLS